MILPTYITVLRLFHFFFALSFSIGLIGLIHLIKFEGLSSRFGLRLAEIDFSV